MYSESGAICGSSEACASLAIHRLRSVPFERIILQHIKHEKEKNKASNN